MATIGDLLKKLETEAQSTADSRMAAAKALFDLSNVDKVLKSEWSRDASGHLHLDGVQIRNSTQLPDISNCINTPLDQNLASCSSDIKDALQASLVLKKLGFKVEEKNTVLGRLKLVESVESWRQSRNLNVLPAPRGGVAQNIDLQSKQIGSTAIDNLRKMVDLVNMNPSILNKGWTPSQGKPQYEPPGVPTPSTKTPPKPAFVWGVLRGGANLEGEVAAMNNVIKSNSFAIKLANGTSSVQLGGGEREYATSLDEVDEKAVFGLRRAYHDLRATLESRGKSLDKNDERTIESELDKHESAVKKLLVALGLLKGMNDLVAKGLITNKDVPLAEVAEKKDHLVKRVEDRKRKLMVILSSLGSAVAVEVPGVAPPSTLSAVGTQIPTPLQNLVVDL
jgi:uncharacterized protein YukE